MDDKEEFIAKLRDCEKRLAVLEEQIASAIDDLKSIKWRLGNSNGKE